MSPALHLDAVLDRLRAHLPELRERFGVEHLAIFGSVARGEAGPGSDVDILVEFRPDARIGFFEFVRLQARLEEILGTRVDLATRDVLKPQLRERILKELIRAA